MRPPVIRSLFLALLTASPAAAQSIYLDMGVSSGSGAPSDAYGAAAGVPGRWNAMRNPSTIALVDTHGQPTTAIAESLNCDAEVYQLPNTNGDDDALLDDFAWADCSYGQLQIDITGLQGGTYQIYLYPIGDGSGADFVLTPGGTGTTSGLGPFPGSYANWHVPVRVFTLPNGGANLRVWCWGHGLSGLQLVRLADATPFCTGDQGYCPCGVGQPGAGCPSSLSSAGASLVGTGAMQVSTDSLQLSASALSNSVVTFFQGTTAQSQGLGATFGDGLRCAGGSTVRLASVLASGGVAQYPGAGDPSISVRGGVPAVGGFRTYQVWYRNAADFCTSATFNLTNGVAVEWQP